MARGGKRLGAGRKPGTRNRRTEETVALADAGGILPLEHMLAVMRDPNMPDNRRDEMAKAAAPYIHARLSTVEHKAPTIDLTGLTVEELTSLETILCRIGPAQ